MREELLHIADRFYESAQEELLNSGSVAMTYVIVGRCHCKECVKKKEADLELMGLPVPPDLANHAEAKIAVGEALRKLCKQVLPEMVMVCSEAWMVRRDDESLIEVPSEAPDKVEILFLAVRLANGKMKLKFGTIVRDAREPLLAGVAKAEWKDGMSGIGSRLILPWSN